jgi:hypothetical protein
MPLRLVRCKTISCCRSTAIADSSRAWKAIRKLAPSSKDKVSGNLFNIDSGTTACSAKAPVRWRHDDPIAGTKVLHARAGLNYHSTRFHAWYERQYWLELIFTCYH